WKLKDHAEGLIAKMKQQGLKPLQTTNYILMETIARMHEYGVSRGTGEAFERAMKNFEMTTREGYAVKSVRDFRSGRGML
ncbi:hypothetical protein BGX27_010195, partial [Mortierella sp. AM989]